LVPVGKTNRYLRGSPVEKPSVLDRPQGSRFGSTGLKTGTYGLFQSVLIACFLVVHGSTDSHGVGVAVE